MAEGACYGELVVFSWFVRPLLPVALAALVAASACQSSELWYYCDEGCSQLPDSGYAIPNSWGYFCASSGIEALLACAEHPINLSPCPYGVSCSCHEYVPDSGFDSFGNGPQGSCP